MWEITFKDNIEADNEEMAYDKLLEYLEDCVKNRDVSVFNLYKEKDTA